MELFLSRVGKKDFLHPLWNVRRGKRTDCSHVWSLMWINILSGRTKLIHEGKGLENGQKVLMTLEPLMLKKFSLSKGWSPNSFECGSGWSSLSGLWLFECGIYPFIMKITPSDGSVGKNLPGVQEIQKTCVGSLGWEDPLGEEMATHFNILAWKIPWTEESGGLQSMGSQRVGYDLVIK